MFIYRPINRSQSTVGSVETFTSPTKGSSSPRTPRLLRGLLAMRRSSAKGGKSPTSPTAPAKRSLYSASTGDLPSGSAPYNYEFVDLDTTDDRSPTALPSIDEHRPSNEVDCAVFVPPVNCATMPAIYGHMPLTVSASSSMDSAGKTGNRRASDGALALNTIKEEENSAPIKPARIHSQRPISSIYNHSGRSQSSSYDLKGIRAGMSNVYQHPRGHPAMKFKENLSMITPVSTSTAFDEQDIVMDDTGAILGGTLAALVKRCMPRRDYCPDKHFLFTFLLNARVFVAPHELLHELVQHCMFEQNLEADNFKKERRTRYFGNILRLCKEWAELFPYDFVSDLMMQRLKDLLSLCAADPTSQVNSTALLDHLKVKLRKLERYENALVDIRRETAHILLPSDHYTGITNTCDSASTVAQQLTHIELERLTMIGPEEFVYFLLRQATNNGFSKTDEDDQLQRDDDVNVDVLKSKTNNIQHYVDWFNRLAALVATDITKHQKKRHRVRLIEFYIDVAKECFNVGNFNSMMAIVNGLNTPVVQRLKKTWSHVEMSRLQILQHQLDPSANFTSYRATLKAAIWRAQSGTAASERIVVPFFTLLIKDLLLVHHKCVRRLPNGHVNFAMFTAFADQLRNFMTWRTGDCQFTRNVDMLNYLLTSPVFDDKGLQVASFECEMAETSSDKELHKRLKGEMNRHK